MPTQIDDQTAFLRRIEAESGGGRWVSMIAFAEWLYEHDQHELGHAFEWAARREVFPRRADEYWSWAQSGWTRIQDLDPVPNMPRSVYEAWGRLKCERFQVLLLDAFNDLARALVALQGDIQAIPPAKET